MNDVIEFYLARISIQQREEINGETCWKHVASSEFYSVGRNTWKEENARSGSGVTSVTILSPELKKKSRLSEIRVLGFNTNRSIRLTVWQRSFPRWTISKKSLFENGGEINDFVSIHESNGRLFHLKRSSRYFSPGCFPKIEKRFLYFRHSPLFEIKKCP